MHVLRKLSHIISMCSLKSIQSAVSVDCKVIFFVFNPIHRTWRCFCLYVHLSRSPNFVSIARNNCFPFCSYNGTSFAGDETEQMGRLIYPFGWRANASVKSKRSKLCNRHFRFCGFICVCVCVFATWFGRILFHCFNQFRNCSKSTL